MRSGKRTGLLAATVALCAASVALPAAAMGGMLDQQQTAFDANSGLGSDNAIAQTFTPAISGDLGRVDLLLFHVASPTDSVTVQIRDASSTGPGSTILASSSVSAASIGTIEAFIPFTLPTPASVTAGTRYSIVALSADPLNDYGWDLSTAADVYPGGAAFYTHDSPPSASTSWTAFGLGSVDAAFKTYVAPSLPVPKKCKHKKKHKSGAVIAKKCKKKHH